MSRATRSAETGELRFAGLNQGLEYFDRLRLDDSGEGDEKPRRAARAVIAALADMRPGWIALEDRPLALST